MNSFAIPVLPGLALVAVLLAGCGDGGKVNPPTQPARPIEAPEVAPEATGSTKVRMGTGPASFVGRWASDVSLCAEPKGPRRPIELTAIRFEGPDRSCHIFSVEETASGYLAELQCRPEDPSHLESLHLTVADKVLTMTWQDRGQARQTAYRCTTLADLSPAKAG